MCSHFLRYSAALKIVGMSSLSFPSAELHKVQSTSLTIPVSCSWSIAYPLYFKLNGEKQMGQQKFCSANILSRSSYCMPYRILTQIFLRFFLAISGFCCLFFKLFRRHLSLFFSYRALSAACFVEHFLRCSKAQDLHHLFRPSFSLMCFVKKVTSCKISHLLHRLKSAALISGTIIMAIVLTGCSKVVIYDDLFCVDAGKFGARCFSNISKQKIELDKFEWDKIRLGQVCTATKKPGEGYSHIKQAIEKLCADSAFCSAEDKRKIEEFDSKVKSAQEEANP